MFRYYKGKNEGYKMRLYIITREPFPDGLAATNRIKCYAKAFLSKGVECKVIVYGRNNFSENILPEGIAEGITYEYIGGSVHRMKGRLRANIQSLFLYIKLLVFLYSSLNIGDVVLGYNQMVGQLTWLLIKVVHSRKAWYISELCELPYGTGCENKMTIMQRNYAYKKLFPRYDGIIAISEALVKEARHYCSLSAAILKIPILVDFENYNIPDKSLSADYPYIFHAGTLYEQKDGILGMIEAFGIALKKSNLPIHFVLTGFPDKSPHKKEIKAIISKYNIGEYIHFLGYVSSEELREYLAKASLVIINKYPTQQNKYCFSTKLGEYMAAGKPLIITRVGEAMNWLTDGYDSMMVDPNDVGQLSDTIFKAFSDVTTLRIIGENARKSCQSFFDYRNYSASLLEMLNMFSTKQIS